jgi:hypothetical protein
VACWRGSCGFQRARVDTIINVFARDRQTIHLSDLATLQTDMHLADKAGRELSWKVMNQARKQKWNSSLSPMYCKVCIPKYPQKNIELITLP